MLLTFVLILAATLTALTAVTAHSATPVVQLSVDSIGQTADSVPGDGQCADVTQHCTLRAAIEESNALGGEPGQVSIGVAPGFSGGNIPVDGTTTNWMRTTPLSAGGGSITGDAGAVFAITSPVTIDLDHKITANNPTELGVGIFYVNGPSITLRGVDQAYAGETSFYVGPDASDVLIENGDIATANYYPERFIVVRGGAKNVTVSNYSVQGYASNARTAWGWGWVDGAETTPVRGLTIERSRFIANVGGARCDNTGASGCASSPLSLQGQKVTDLVFSNNTVKNLNRGSSTDARVLDLRSSGVQSLTFVGNKIIDPQNPNGQALVDMGGANAAADIRDFTIDRNTITGAASGSEDVNGLVRLPTGKSISGTGAITRNTFSSAGTSAAGMQAIYWQGALSDNLDVPASHVTIESNSFDGFGSSARSSIRLHRTGAVVVRRNTFGTNSGTQANTTREEGAANGSTESTLFNNQTFGANGKLNTWYPAARSSANVQSAPVLASGCSIPLEIAPPTDPQNTTDLNGARNPQYPATVDVYWTAGNTAEVLIGSYTVASADRQTIDVTLPLAGDERLSALPSGARLPVDPTTGAVAGGLRLQTQDTTIGASSQLSRVALIGGTCRPEITINQADTQNDPSMGRDLHWTLTSSVPLDPSTLSRSDIALSAAPTPDTLDAARLAPRVVSVTALDERDPKRFDVIARVDDSAAVTASLPAGAVSSPGGLTNAGPAASTDPIVTFRNPISISPSSMTVVTGDAKAKPYHLKIRAGAPIPTADVRISAIPDENANEHEVTVSPQAPVVQAGEFTSERLHVRSAPGRVTAGSPAGITHLVKSDDANYDGLLAPSLKIALFTTDPRLSITKRAYVDVTDVSSPSLIESTGTEVPTDARLIDGQRVCFVYTATNISKGEWATSLTDAIVTDSDTRLGKNGVIGTVPLIAVNGSAQLSACTTIIPTDQSQGVTP